MERLVDGFLHFFKELPVSREFREGNGERQLMKSRHIHIGNGR